ncbi:RteC domain-containing protein [Flavobacterium sp. SM2513]|uniref:RteC domain-containing protein n=1 Tax=Flavobacterium sp. SM2513 TaxID=3424766 RepID=UPI003D7F44FB
MRTYAQELITDLNHKLEEIHSTATEPMEYSENAIIHIVSILEKLKNFFLQYKFENKKEEIQFFREIKPQFASKLIYYNEIYNIEAKKPFGAAKVQRKYYNNELAKLNVFFDENSQFYEYFRTGNRCFDKKYFRRGKFDIKLNRDSCYFQTDHSFSTSHDFKVAKILANEQLKTYIQDRRAALHKHLKKRSAGRDKNALQWTASKVALTELIYALHSEGVFNNGASDLKDITAFFESTFDVDLGQFHRTFLDIRSRTSERTKFLNGLRDKLITRMDATDQ